MQKRLTQGPVMPTMLRFAVPMILGDLLQQCYNIADTLVVGRFIGTNALAAVGSAFTLMTFLTSILLGLAMGSGTVFSIKFGQKDDTGLREGVLAAFVLLAIVTAVLTGAVYLGFEGIIWFLRLPAEIAPLMRTYLKIVFAGLAAIFLYNYFASLLRALGNSMVPLLFLALSAGLNIALDLWFVCGLGRGVGGAAEATVIAQYVSGVGISVYTWVRFPPIFTLHLLYCAPLRLTTLLRGVMLMLYYFTLGRSTHERTAISHGDRLVQRPPGGKKGAAGCQHGGYGGCVSAVSGPAGLVGLACHVGAAGGYCRGACGSVCGGYGSACGH